MNKFAKDGASLVPIAVPPICKNSLLSKRKLLVVRTNSNSLQRDELVGFLVGDLFFFFFFFFIQNKHIIHNLGICAPVFWYVSLTIP